MSTASGTRDPAHSAFREAICAEPDEPVHRLVYADWLTDHGTTPLDAAQAELIRVQFALEAATPDDPAWWMLRARERVLLARWRRDLAGPARRFLRRYRFRRGFLDWAEVEGDVLAASAGDLFRLAPLLSVAVVGSVDDLRARHLARLAGLDLTQAKRRSHSPSHLCRLLDGTRLKALDVPAGYAGQLPAFLQTEGADRLEHLGLADAVARPDDWPADLLRHLVRSPVPGRLTSLRLPTFGTTGTSVAAFTQSPWLAGLGRLRVVGEHRGGMAFATALSHAPAAIGLRALSLGNLDFDTPTPEPGPNLKLLREVSLAGDGMLRPEQAVWLRGLDLYQARSLALGGFALWYDGLGELFLDPPWPCLHTLELESARRFTRCGYRNLLDGPLVGRLRRLVLTRMAPDELLRLLRSGPATGRLRELCLRETWFDSPGGQQLAQAGWLAGLTHLEATGLHADVANLFDLLLPERFPHLAWLDLRGEEVPTDLAELLRERFGVGVRLQPLVRQRSPYHLQPLPADPEADLAGHP